MDEDDKVVFYLEAFISNDGSATISQVRQFYLSIGKYYGALSKATFPVYNSVLWGLTFSRTGQVEEIS